MLAKKFRLPSQEFKKKFDKSFKTSYFLVKISGNQIGHNRFGIVMSAKVEKKSTARHYLKRRLSEIFRGQPNLRKDFLIIILPNINNLPKGEIVSEANKIFGKIF